MIINKPGLLTIKGAVRMLAAPRAPKSVSTNFHQINKQDMEKIKISLKHNYFSANDLYLSSKAGQEDLENHLYRRLNIFRNTVIPWLNSARRLRGARILEIGCGTGSSTVALSEQGAKVTAIDILDSSIAVAKERCRIYDVEVEFFNLNATDINKVFLDQHFDFIIFFATLEHMTYEERMIAMKHTWDMLSKDGLWCIIECPNRMWFYDEHTSLLPFYHWLPDNLALKYAQFSPRKALRDQFGETNEKTMLDFLRRGRGVSFHEFELTMDRAENLDVISSLPIFLRKQNILRNIRWRLTIGGLYEMFLSKVGPKIHKGFYQQSLDLIIRKN